MNIYQLLFIATAFLAAPVYAADVSEADKIAIAKFANLKETNGEYYETSCGSEDLSEFIGEDLNKDGQHEVFVRTQGMCLGGPAGSAISLYIKDSDGNWLPNLGFPGDYKVLETSNLGFADLEITGPGDCFPVWRWNGSAYDLYKKC